MSPSSSAPADPDDIAAWLALYEPRTPNSSWDAIGAFVRAAVAQTQPVSIDAAARTMRVLTKLATWCLAEGLPLDQEQILDPAVVERFVSVSDAPWRSRATYRALLRRIGPMLTRNAPWECRPTTIAHRSVAAPYSVIEVEQLRVDAGHQSIEGRRRAARTLLALGAGAGLDGRWVSRVTPADVITVDGVVLVRVGEPTPRVVPVLAEWEDEVLELAGTASSGALIGKLSSAPNRLSALSATLTVGRGHPRFSASRMRSTWLLAHLRSGTRLPELAKAAGLAGITTLSDLLPQVDAMGDDEARRLLRGPS